MSEKYFEKFPVITYNDAAVIDITERVVIKNFPANNAFLYYPYEIESVDRPDQLADKALDDQFMDWMLYLSNGVTDPYYDWYVRDDVFGDYLKKKYQYDDIQVLTQKVMYYRNNWYNSVEMISGFQYDILPSVSKYNAQGQLYLDTTKRYYEPVYTGSKITGYQRKRIDEVLNTNKIVRYNIAGTSSFANDEIVSVSLGYANSTTDAHVGVVVGGGQVLTSNSTTVTIQHTRGFVDSVSDGYNFDAVDSYISGTENGSNCAITSYSSLANNIVGAEASYWSPVTVYEHELENNAKNKTIRIIDSAQAKRIARQASNLLSQKQT